MPFYLIEDNSLIFNNEIKDNVWKNDIVMKYIVVNGGVISGLGKGITASSIGLLFKESGYTVTAVKIDPYLNVDAGTMSPYEHGEVYVLEDGTETDLDLGNYERFLGIKLQKDHSITSGKVFQKVIENERRGKYIGQTVQFIPHVTNAIVAMLQKAARVPMDGQVPDICIVELGGTVGDMESMHFVEALRQMRCSAPKDFCLVGVSMLLSVNGEEKTKPTQQCVQEMRRLGLAPDMLVLRSETMISDDAKRKISMHCHVAPECIIANTNTQHIYEVPERLNAQNIVGRMSECLGLNTQEPPSVKWAFPSTPVINVAIVGKYTKTHDTYLSIHRALEHAAFAQDRPIHITYVSCEEANVCDTLSRYHGVVIPGGFGGRGLEGIIACAQTCRNQNIPLLGICLGMQMMCIAAIRNQYDNRCTSCESIDSDGVPVEFHSVVPIASLNHSMLGGTMKLGKHATHVRNPSTRTYQLYGAPANQMVFERHRHRYEINPEHVPYLQQDGITVSGYSTEDCVDIVEDVSKRFYIGCQFHPEYQSQLHSQSPLFTEFIKQSSI